MKLVVLETIPKLAFRYYNMKYVLLLFTFSMLIQSCASDDDNGIDCSVVDCAGGDMIFFELLIDDQNIFEIEPQNVLVISQNNQDLNYNRSGTTNIISLFLQFNDPITISINDQELNMQIESTFLQGECCSGIRVDKILVDGNEICNNEDCDENLQISID